MIKVICVEDDETTRNLISHCLRSNGYQVITVDGVLSAMTTMASENVDFALIDYHLPVYNGDDLISFVQDRGIPYAFLTADLDVEVDGDVIDKVSDLKKLPEKIEAVRRGESLPRRKSEYHLQPFRKTMTTIFTLLSCLKLA